MADQVTKTPDFRQKLKRQLELLWANCREFDDGNSDKALEIAVRLRVLFHTTANSTSALAHLDAEDIQLLSTAPVQKAEKTFFSEGGLTIARFRRGRMCWEASLDTASNRRLVPFLDWWSAEIVSVYTLPYTRRSIVLDTANKDDGAHIDRGGSKALATLIDGPWRYSGGGALSGQPTQQNLHFQYLRQIAYETLHSKDLLDLLPAGSSIESDADYACRQNAMISGRMARLSQLYKSAAALHDLGDAKTALDTWRALMDEIGANPDRASARIYCRTRFALAMREGAANDDVKLAQLTQLVNDIWAKVRPISPSVDFMDIVVRTQLDIGLIHQQRGDEAAAKRCWEFVREVARDNINPEDAENPSACASPLCFYLWSTTNIAAISMNRGAYGDVLAELSTVTAHLERRCSDLICKWNQEQIEDACDAEHGISIARSVFKCLRNIAIAEFALGRKELAASSLAALRDRFHAATDPEIIRLSDEGQRVFDGELKLQPAFA